MTKILVLGSDGYVGTVYCRELEKSGIEFAGIDAKWFSAASPQISSKYGDVRDLDLEALGFVPSSIVFLAAVSNDPGGERFSRPTFEINAFAAQRIAAQAKSLGVSRFVVASSCSTYGKGVEVARSEDDEVSPLTAYARSKVLLEELLGGLADSSFQVVALRFATACGPSPSQRLDLVLNDFVASAMYSGLITLTSNGEPWRPLIDVRDMARAISWATSCDASAISPFEIVNVGSEQAVFRIIDLARQVASVFPGTRIEVGHTSGPDDRSYKVDFSKFRSLAPEHQPKFSVRQSIVDLMRCLEAGEVSLFAPRRLSRLLDLLESGFLDEELRWCRGMGHETAIGAKKLEGP